MLVEPSGHYSIEHGRAMTTRNSDIKISGSEDALIWELLNAKLALSFSKLAAIRFMDPKSNRDCKGRLEELVYFLKIMELHDARNVEKSGAFIYEDAMTTVTKALFPQIRDFEHTHEIKLTQADVDFLKHLEPEDFEEGNVLKKNPRKVLATSDAKNIQFTPGDVILNIKDDKLTRGRSTARGNEEIKDVPEIRHFGAEALCPLFKDLFERGYLKAGSKVEVKSVRKIKLLRKEEIPIVRLVERCLVQLVWSLRAEVFDNFGVSFFPPALEREHKELKKFSSFLKTGAAKFFEEFATEIPNSFVNLRESSGSQIDDDELTLSYQTMSDWTGDFEEMHILGEYLESAYSKCRPLKVFLNDDHKDGGEQALSRKWRELGWDVNVTTIE